MCYREAAYVGYVAVVQCERLRKPVSFRCGRATVSDGAEKFSPPKGARPGHSRFATTGGRSSLEG